MIVFNKSYVELTLNTLHKSVSKVSKGLFLFVEKLLNFVDL